MSEEVKIEKKAGAAGFFIVLSGIYLLLLGAVMAGIAFSVFAAAPSGNLHMVEMVFGVGLYVVLALGFFATAIGIFFHKNWARISLFVMTGLALFIGFSTCTSLIFARSFMTGHEHHMPPHFWGMAEAVVSVLMILIPGLLIVLFRSRGARVWFRLVSETGEEVPAGKKGRPLIVTLVAIYYAFSIFSFMIFLSPAARKMLDYMTIGNIRLTPPLAALYFCSFTILALILAWGLFKRERWGWPMLVGLNVFYFLLGAVNVLFMSDATAQRVIDMMQANNPNTPIHMTVAHYKNTLFVGLIVPILILIIAFWKKKAFLPEERSADAPGSDK